MHNVPGRTARRILLANLALAALVLCLGAVALVRRIHRYDALILEAGRLYGVDARLISAVIWRESGFHPSRVGAAGEIGLMQVTVAAAREWAQDGGPVRFEREDLFDPAANIRAGTWYLGRALRRWSDRPDPLPFALAEYNAGRSNALRWAEKSGPDPDAFLEAITYPTTRRYVRDILRRYRGRAPRRG